MRAAVVHSHGFTDTRRAVEMEHPILSAHLSLAPRIRTPRWKPNGRCWPTTVGQWCSLYTSLRASPSMPLVASCPRPAFFLRLTLLFGVPGGRLKGRTAPQCRRQPYADPIKRHIAEETDATPASSDLASRTSASPPASPWTGVRHNA